MKQSTTATLLSALVFPGIGQLYLKRTRLGITLLGISLVTMAYILAVAIENIVQLSEKIQLREMALDANTITELALQSASGTNTPLLLLASSVFTICWVISLVDALRSNQTDAEQ